MTSLLAHKDILLLERVQRHATKYILSDYTSNYKARLLSLHILPLMYWLELHDILYLVKALKFPSDNMPILRYISFSKSNTQSSCHNRLQHNYCRTSVSHHFYFNRIVRLWNKLPSIDLSRSIPSIKYNLISHLWEHFNIHFDPTIHAHIITSVHAALVLCSNSLTSFMTLLSGFSTC